MQINLLLQRAAEAGASDIHLKAGRPPILRHDGQLAPLDD
jgi:Tfp pilus assembly pilus retraction ATPase PilT